MNLRYVYVFSKVYGFKAIKRFVPYIIYALLVPLSLLFIFRMVSPASLFPFAIVGGLISVFVSDACILLFDAANFRLRMKFHDLLIATRLTPVDYTAGFILCEFLFAIPSIIIYVLIGIFYHIYVSYLFFLMLIILLVLFLTVSFISFVLSFLPRYMRSVWSYNGIIILLLTLFPPVFYPYTALPKPLFYALLIIPSTSASAAIQGLYGLTPVFSPAIYILAAEFAVSLVLALFFTKWRSK